MIWPFTGRSHGRAVRGVARAWNQEDLRDRDADQHGMRPEVVEKMARTGFRYVTFGIESMHDHLLEFLNKTSAADH